MKCFKCGSDEVYFKYGDSIINSYFYCWNCNSYLCSNYQTDEEIEVSYNDPYLLLSRELAFALEQASGGKGKERHAKEGQRFEDQIMCVIQRILIDHPMGGLAYQVIKKTIESGRLFEQKGVDAAKAEIYGAINYLSGMNIIYEEQRKNFD